MKTLFIIFVGLVLSGSLWASDEEMELRQFKLRGASVLKVFQTVEKATSVPIKFQASADFQQSLPPFNFDFDRIPVSAVLLLVCADAGLEYRVENGTVNFYPAGTLNREKAKAKRPQVGGTSMTIGNIGYYPIGYRPPTMSVVNGVTVITGPVPIFRKYVSGIEMTSRPVETSPSTAKKKEKEKPPATHFDDIGMEQHLSQIKLVGLSASNISLTDVLDYLRRESRAQASDNCSVNLYVSAKVDIYKQNLTIAMEPCSLFEAVRLVASAAKLKYRIEPWGVVFY